MISRRDFLKSSLAVVSLGVGVPSVFSKAVVAAAAERSSASVSGKTLIIVQMAGRLDGLATVIPYTDPVYRTQRPALALNEEEMIVVDDRVAFHPEMAKLKELLDAGQLAVVEGVGYPNPNFSHFKALDIWQTADPGGVAGEGWLGRYFDGLADPGGHPLAALSVGRRLPTAFESRQASVPTVQSVESFGLRPGPDGREASLLRLYDLYRPADSAFAALLDTTLDTALSSADGLAAAHAAYEPALTYPESSLASGLRLLAELIDSGEEQSPLRVGHVTIGGFGTHSGEEQRLTQRLGQTSEALYAFWQDIVAHGHAQDVMVMTWSEFGRRPIENASGGTDHGSAGPMFLIGDVLKAGFHGEPPSLTSLDDGNLRFTTDFRSVYAAVLERWLEAPAQDVLGARFEPLDLIAV